jgi:predicted S18 family serine protease
MYWYLYYARQALKWLKYAMELRMEGKTVSAEVAKEMARYYVDKAEKYG